MNNSFIHPTVSSHSLPFSQVRLQCSVQTTTMTVQTGQGEDIAPVTLAICTCTARGRVDSRASCISSHTGHFTYMLLLYNTRVGCGSLLCCQRDIIYANDA